MWTNYSYLTNDPRWLLDEQFAADTLRWGPGFIGQSSKPLILPAEFARWSYIEYSRLDPLPVQLWTTYWQLNEYKLFERSNFSFWLGESDHQLGTHLQQISFGDLLEYEYPLWLANWGLDLDIAYKVKYVLQSAELLSQNHNQPGAQLTIDGSLLIRAANRAQMQEIYAQIQEILEQQDPRQFSNLEQDSALRLSRTVNWYGKERKIGYRVKDDQFAFEPTTITSLTQPIKIPEQPLIQLGALFYKELNEVQIWLIVPTKGKVEIYRQASQRPWSSTELKQRRARIQQLLFSLPLIIQNWQQNKQILVLALNSWLLQEKIKNLMFTAVKSV